MGGRVKRNFCIILVLSGLGLILLSPPDSSAIPSFTRIYGLKCVDCHSASPELNDFGEDFRLSGFRRYGGVELAPKVQFVKIGDRLTLPGIVALSFSGTIGYNYAQIDNTTGDGGVTAPAGFDQRQSSFNLNEFKLLAGSSLGRNLSFFLDAPLAHTTTRQFFAPEVSDQGLDFELVGPDFPNLAYVTYNDIFLQDFLNLKGGVFELPTAFSPYIHRHSFFPYLVYEITSLEVISSKRISEFVEVSDEDSEMNHFRISRSQLGAQLFGRLSPSLHKIPDIYVDYAGGAVNGNNTNIDNNNDKDIFGRLAISWRMPSTTIMLGGFGYNTLHREARNPSSGVEYESRLLRYGPDLRFTLIKPFYLNLFSQILFGEDSNVTGFGKEARWWGGFVQGEVMPRGDFLLFGRYEWIKGDRFDDTDVTINGVSGSVGPVVPRLWDAVFGAQYFLYENFKLIAEYRHGVKDMGAVPPDPTQLAKTEVNEGFVGVRCDF